MEKREFLKLIKSFFSFSIIGWFLSEKSYAVWRRVGKASGTPGTWQKIINRTPRIVNVRLGGGHSFAIDSEGRLFGAGEATGGRLGNNVGTSTFYSTFVPVVGVSNVISVTPGYYHSLALRSDGYVFSSGHNDLGQLGHGGTVSVSTFTQVFDLPRKKRTVY